MIHRDTTHMVTQSYLKQTSFHLYPLVEASSVMLSWSSSIYQIIFFKLIKNKIKKDCRPGFILKNEE
jgi:hypothetical protein